MNRHEVIIIGAGSTGLVLANLLEQAGFDVLVIEKRPHRGTHSRAIGIHPPGLKILDRIGVLDQIIKTGVSVFTGFAHVNALKVGELSLATNKSNWDRIITIPQYLTEEILEQSLTRTTVLRGWVLKELTHNDDGVRISIESESKSVSETRQLESTFLIGADGMNSTVRSLLNIGWSGKTYPFRYAMADVTDNTDFGSNAAIFLSRNGLTESFPLPHGVRRWVVNHNLTHIDKHAFFDCIIQRTGHHPDRETTTMFSEFEIHQFIASKMYDGNVFLSGDALGVMSPIGGQAMSLHWNQVFELFELLQQYRTTKGIKIPDFELNKLQRKQLKRLKQYSDRSHFNTVMGLPGTPNWILKIVSKVFLAPGIKNYWSKRFSMRDLK
jgi:2-polyprenyl-6-methoxyphenol hydroxylase-like FAD-dependent oxidoreductase